MRCVCVCVFEIPDNCVLIYVIFSNGGVIFEKEHNWDCSNCYIYFVFTITAIIQRYRLAYSDLKKSNTHTHTHAQTNKQWIFFLWF